MAHLMSTAAFLATTAAEQCPDNLTNEWSGRSLSAAERPTSGTRQRTGDSGQRTVDLGQDIRQRPEDIGQGRMTVLTRRQTAKSETAIDRQQKKLPIIKTTKGNNEPDNFCVATRNTPFQPSWKAPITDRDDQKDESCKSFAVRLLFAGRGRSAGVCA